VPIQTEDQVHRGLGDKRLIPAELAELMALDAAAFYNDRIWLQVAACCAINACSKNFI